MSPPLDLESLRRQYPDMPGWGERVFLELYEIKNKVVPPGWTAKDFGYIITTFVGALVAVKAAGIA